MSRSVRLTGKVPEKPHLVGYDGIGLATAYPVGATMGVIPIPDKPDYMARMLLVEVTRAKMVFRCTCNPTCQTVITYHREETGRHAR